MTENEAIELHIAENLHRIEVIEEFLRTNSDADDKECKKNIRILTKVNGALQEIQQYRSIGTVKECREARERQRGKKPVLSAPCKSINYYLCPNCNKILNINKPFCCDCGSGIDWSEEDV